MIMTQICQSRLSWPGLHYFSREIKPLTRLIERRRGGRLDAETRWRAVGSDGGGSSGGGGVLVGLVGRLAGVADEHVGFPKFHVEGVDLKTSLERAR